jgi:hypothetical protein
MSNYIFLTENYNEGPTTYYAINADKIKTMNESDTYDKHGQLISCGDAGDSLSLSTGKGVEIANKLANKYEEYEESPADFEVGNIISAYENGSLYEDIIGAYNAGELTEIDIDITRSQAKGFNYWNGHNWGTVTTSVNNGESSHSIVDDEALITELNEAIENKSFEKSGFGCEVFSHDKWVIIDSNWQGDFASYEIMTEIDYECRQQNSSALPALED